MNEIVNYLELLKERTKNNPIKAVQDLELPDPAPGQLHRWAEFEEFPELFYLVTEINDEYCEVIPGSLDAVMAGTEDIILPKDVLGDFVFLSLDMAATLPRKAIGKGFAILDDATYNRVIDSQIEYETGSKGEMPSFAFAALGFAGKEDSRRIYHHRMSEIIQGWQNELLAAVFEDKGAALPAWDDSRLMIPRLWAQEEYALAAGEEKENIYLTCVIEGRPECVKVIWSPDEKTLRLTIFDDGKRTTSLDKAEVVDINENTLGVIADGKCFMTGLEELDGCFALRLEDGEILLLNCIEE